jgi:hypothetical protein
MISCQDKIKKDILIDNVCVFIIWKFSMQVFYRLEFLEELEYY